MLGLHPIARKPPATLRTAILPVQATARLYYADRGLTTGPGDAPAHTHFEARLTQPLAWSRTLLAGGRLGGRADFRAGESELDNADGALTRLVREFAVDGRRVRIAVGLPHWAYADHMTLFDGTAAGWRFGRGPGAGRALLALRGMAYRLDQPIQTRRYAGTGGAEGDADVADRPKPLAFGGTLYNVPAVRLGPELVYQVHDGPVLAIDGVFDNASALAFSGSDHASYAALAAAAIAPGEYDTALALGLFRLGSEPNPGPVTCDLRGGLFDGAFEDRPHQLLRRIATTFGGLAESELDAGSFAALGNTLDVAIAYWVGPRERRIPEVLNELVASFEGYWGDRADGTLQVGQVRKPAGGFQVAFDDGDIFEAEELDLPSAVQPVLEAARVGYRKVWLVQQEAAQAAAASRKEFVQSEHRVTGASDGTVSSFNLRARQLFVPGFWDAKAGAEAHAQFLLDLYGPGTRLRRVSVGHKGYKLDIGRKCRLTYGPLAIDGEVHRVIGINLEAGRNRVELTLLR